MNIQEEVQKLKCLPVEEQAKQKIKGDSNGWWFVLFGFIVGLLYAICGPEPKYNWNTHQIDYGALSKGGGFLLFNGIGIIIGIIYAVKKNRIIDSEYNKIVLAAKDEMSRRREEKSAQEKKKRNEHIEALYGKDRKTIDFSKKSYTRQIIVSEEKELIRICEKDLKFSDILNFKVTDDSKDIYTPAKYETKTDTGSMLGRAVVGGILTGGVGAVIGGTTAKKEIVQTSEQVHRISHDYRIYVYINNLDESQLEIRLYSDVKTTEKIAGVLTYVLNKNEEKKNASQVAKESTQGSSNSVADELSKLVRLKDQGILTEEEFLQQKAKLLSV